MVSVLNSEGEARGERVELRWKLWLREKEILLWARLVKEMIKVGEIVGTVRSECSRIQCSIVFGFGFSNLIQAWHRLGQESNDWGHGMTQALGLPLHEFIAKNRVINSSWNFTLIICA